MTPGASDAHGGDVERVARETGIALDQILDFSANVNPLGLPRRALERLARDSGDARLLSRYPSPQATELRSVLSERLGIAPECIVIGAGADDLLHAAVRALNPRACLIPIPAFCEYERACHACGCVARTIPLAPGFTLDRKSLELAGPGDVMIVNNPHNPTGACLNRGEMLGLIASVTSSGAMVIADEAFIDYVPGAAITREACAQPGVIAIRSLTKFFGCPGLRVGYAAAAAETAHRVRAQMPAWPVTTLAVNALSEALQDGDYIRESLEKNEAVRLRLSAALASLGCQVFPPAANFLFLRVPDKLDAAEIRARLLHDHAILVRECDSFAGLERGRYLRVAVRLETENARLIEALASVMRGSSCHQNSASNR